MGVSNKITSIAIPLGATVNMDAVSTSDVLHDHVLWQMHVELMSRHLYDGYQFSLANVLTLSLELPGSFLVVRSPLRPHSATMAGLPAGVMGV